MNEEKMNEMTDEEATKKAEKMEELSKRIAEQHASAFEAWLNENRSATKEEAHERLTKTIEAALMMHLMMFTLTL